MSERPAVKASRAMTGSNNLTGRKCALCGKRYVFCKCVCRRCGARVWAKNGDAWEHHVCRKWGGQAAKT